MTLGAMLSTARRRIAAVFTPPVTDDFSATLSGTRWPTVVATTTTTGGRLRVVPSASYPGASTGVVFHLNQYPLWVQVTTLPNVGNGTNKVRFILEDASFNSVYFTIEWSGTAWTFFIWGSPTLTSVSGSATPAYNATNHQYLRFRISGANLVFEASPDDVTWTALRTVVSPSWLTTGLVRATLQAYFTGTEPTPGFVEYDNFNL